MEKLKLSHPDCSLSTRGHLLMYGSEGRKLIQLRNRNGKGYTIPYGGLFAYVSCPNFLGEIITWTGFFVVTFSWPAFSFLIWSIVNLVPRALDHHRWYRNTFTDYPENRKAIFPGLL